MNHFASSPMKPRRPKQKIEKSNEEFKEHERIIMDKRIAEINNVITKKCHTLWNQYLYFKKKPHTLQFNFVYHGLENYLAKCDDYKAEQHKDNKQKWWNNQKASEMSQQFLPSVLNSTDHMAQYLGKEIESNLQIEFTNYVIFELLETAITSVFSTQRSGSNEVFLRTSFQYAKAGLRKKLVSYFGDGELREYDTKSRKKKDLWQRLIKDKKEKLVQIFLHKKSIYSQDSKVGIISDIVCGGGGGDHSSMSACARMGLYDNKQYLYDTNTNNINCGATSNDQYMMNPPPSTQQQLQQPQLFDSSNGYCNPYDVNNGYAAAYADVNNNVNGGVSNAANNLALMDGLNGATLPFPQPLLMDITLTYPNHNNNNHTNTTATTNNNNNNHRQQQATIPPPVVSHVPTKTAVYDATHSHNNLNNNRNTQQQHASTTATHMNMNMSQCRQCLEYMSKISQLLKVNQAMNDDSAQLKQVNIKYEAERDHWKSQYQQLFKQYQSLLRQNNDLQNNLVDIKPDMDRDGKMMQMMEDDGDDRCDLSIKSQTTQEDDEEDCDDDDDDDDDTSSLKQAEDKYTPSFSNMSVSRSSKNHNNNNNNNNGMMNGGGGIPPIPLDDLAKTPKELQPFAQFITDSTSITPYENSINNINPFPFPSSNNNNNKSGSNEDVINENNNKEDEDRDDVMNVRGAIATNSNKSNNKCTAVSVAPSVMSICSNHDPNNMNNKAASSYFTDSSNHLMSAFNAQFNSEQIQSMVQ